MCYDRDKKGLHLAKEKQEERALDIASAELNERYYKGDIRDIMAYKQEVKNKIYKDNFIGSLHIITGDSYDHITQAALKQLDKHFTLKGIAHTWNHIIQDQKKYTIKEVLDVKLNGEIKGKNIRGQLLIYGNTKIEHRPLYIFTDSEGKIESAYVITKEKKVKKKLKKFGFKP